MTEHEIKRKKNRKRRKKKRATSETQDVQISIQENLDIGEPVTKKIRLDSQVEGISPTPQVCTKTQLELSLNSKEITSNTRVSEINGQENSHLQQTISDRADMTASPSMFDPNGQVVDTYSNNHTTVKTYMVTDKDLIQLARVKENEQYDEMGLEKHMNGHPVITFSISGNDLVHLELVQDEENEVTESFKEKEQIEN